MLLSYIQPCSFSPPYKVLLQGGRSSSSLSSSSPLDNSFVHFLYLPTLLYSFSSPFHATSQNAQSLASYYFVSNMAAVAVPRLLVNGNRTGGAAAAEVHTGDSPSCNRPLLRPAAWVARSESEKASARRARFRKKTQVLRQFFACLIR